MRFIALTILAGIVLLSGCVSQPPAGSPSPTASALPQVKECGGNWACIVTYASTCTPARAKPNMSMDFFGIVEETTSALEITGKKGDGCELRLRNERISIWLNDTLVKQLRDSGSTDAQIRQKEDELNAGMKIVQGSEATCVLQSGKLVKMLSSWADGRFSSDDLAISDCQGSLFTPPNAKLQEDGACPLELAGMLSVNGVTPPLNELSLAVGAGYEAQAVKFSGDGSQVEWAIQDTSVATVSPAKGKSAVVNVVGPGTTSLTLRDPLAGPDCKKTIPVSSLGQEAAPTAPVQEATACSTEDCFYEKLSSCTPAQYVFGGASSPSAYAIEGRKNGACSIRMKVEAGSQAVPEWVGLEMTCSVLDSSLTKEGFTENYSPAGMRILADCRGSYIDKLKATTGTG